MAALLVAKYERQRNVTGPHPRHDRFYWQHWQRSIDLLVKVGDLSLTDAAICHAVAGFSNASGKTVYPAQQGTVALIDRMARPADDVCAVRSDCCGQFAERCRNA